MAVPVEIRGDTFPGSVYAQAPQNVYWETTIACDLDCKHCRADANPNRHPLELSFEQGKELMRSVKAMGSLMVLTGGDPMKREDIFDLMSFGREIKLPMAVTPSTTPLLTRDIIAKFRDLNMAAMGVSLDGPSAEVHDSFRKVTGTFARSMLALDAAREFKLPVQVNTSITTETIPHLQALYELLRDQATPPVRRWSLFLLVPVGRGVELGLPSALQVEQLFGWVYSISAQAPFHVSTVEAPHYRRFFIQRKLEEGIPREQLQKMARKMGFGVRDGNGVIFVSHLGEVYPAGFLPYPLLGNVKDRPISEIYRDSPALQELRDAHRLKGRCGRCEFKWVCGGSRARAYGMLQDPFQEDPLCAFYP
ncbi:MAG: TIGR04053 family radical SAM/SPASM domain-containing protein [Deltaproteobacteria bacterium]|nr:TIGR04053 family radical SAM/SPASM domain-containing protein [Deltaproteobacteria bacterium]